ncbi:glycosyltransferase [Actinophytocola xinjiangensis]|uniref:glycosyltransferase n=1 Tax=Actinophytocola xinjiangensis TaxID=485602 RepID=UPI000B263626|nr:glycosyltransferase [Actinophytocola xinjiangensis]
MAVEEVQVIYTPEPVVQPTARTVEPRLRGHAHVVLPAYNEEAALPALLKRLAVLARTEELTVWVVDDGSTDRTADIAAIGLSGLAVRLIRHETNLGLGQAVRSGLQAVLAAAGPEDVVVVMDADDTHDPTLIPPLQDQIQAGADIAICSRFVRGGDDSSAPGLRRLLSRTAALVLRRLLGLADVRDFTSGFRAYRVAVLERATHHWGERLIEERGFACMVELLIKLRHCEPVVTEVPLLLRYDRKPGGSKLALGTTLVQYLLLLVRTRLAPPPYRDL